MRLEWVEVSGLLAFRSPQRLDLRDLPSGLIAVCGPNGAGKTTLLEAPLAALYRQWPSRGRDLVDYVRDRRASLEVVFSLDGHGLYRARVDLDGVRRQSEAVLEEIGPAGRRRLSDGRVSSYDAAVRRLLPPLEVLLASAFAAQNRAGSFLTLDRRGRKDLFAELLGLRYYEALAARARDRAAETEQRRAAVLALRERLAAEAGPAAERALADRAARLRADTDALDARRQAIAVRMATLTAEREAHQTEAARYATLRAAADRHEAEEVAYRQAVAQAEQALQQWRRDCQAERDRIAAAHARAEQRLDEDLADLDRRLAEHRRILERAETIRAATVAVATAEAKRPLLRDAALAARERVRVLVEERAALERRAAAWRQAERDWEQARRAADLLSRVPCGGAGAYAACEFLRDARHAREQLPVLEARVAEAAAQVTDRDALEVALAEAKAAEAAAEAAVAELERTLTSLRETAREAAALEVAEHRLADAERARAEIARRRAALAEETARELAALDQRAAARQADLEADLARLRRAAEAAAAARAALEPALQAAAPAHARLAQTEAALQAAQAEWAATEAARGRLEADQAALARDRETFAARRHELDTVATDLARLDQDLVEWRLLARLLSRDGLPVLEIDAAGPGVSALTNDLLQACFGPRFLVELVTQEATADGKGFKEAFALKVIDGERGGEPRDLTDLSGGEQILVDECLKSAIAIYVNERSQTPIRTLFRDETTGALDEENALRYVAMLRRVQQVSGVHQVLYVTHHPEAAALADAQIVVRDGQVTVKTSWSAR